MKKYKVLIIDDDDSIADSLSLLLEMEGYEATAIDTAQLCEEIQRIIPDLILLDVWLSGMDGRDICRKIKEYTKDKDDIPVILTSASRELGRSVKEAGANAFIEKPFELPVLLDTIETLISEHNRKKL